MAKKFIKSLCNSGICTKDEIDATIFYEYISRRLCDNENQVKNCHVFSVKHEHPDVMPLFENILSIDSPIRFKSEKSKVYDFKIDDIKLVYLGDSIGFFVYQLHFIANVIDTTVMANSLYFLKKTTITKLLIKDKQENGFSFLDLSLEIIRKITNNQSEHFGFSCFFHIAKRNARSNYLLMANISTSLNDSKCKKALYYLNNGFCDKYQYRESSDNSDTIYFAPNGRCWGISPESSVCLIRFRHEAAEKKMFSEFKKSYFLLYTFLLYQKYSYYYFLSKIDISKNMHTKEIKKYQDELIDFEIESVFSIITEIPQYMGFYKSTCRYII
ncbi:MAG: hypothetical protein IJA34_10925 [Lachnospiraceae bacterium]|nr:hypothetical protein [Lachnospiraceae bacterium]